MNNNIVTRFPPSPTGLLHVGSLRTFLYNYFFTKQNDGKIVFRSEDTDKERSKPEYHQNIIDALNWVGVSLGVPLRQSERGGVYKTYLKKLVDENKAYISKEEPKEEGQRSEVIRLRNPGNKIIFNDLILGDIESDTTELGDFVIAKDLDTPLYHLAVVVDDFDMGVTHVIRGQDHIANTARQILIQEAIGAPRPFYAHIPLILSPDKSKMSKRYGAVAVTQFRDAGYLPQTIINFMSLVGWNPGDEREIFSMDELIREFRIEKVHKSGAVFDVKKLDWMNKEYIKKMTDDEFTAKATEFTPNKVKMFPSFTPNLYKKILLTIARDRIVKFGDIKEMAEAGDFDYYFEIPRYEKDMLKTVEFLPATIDILNGVAPADFTQEGTKAALWDFATEKGRGNVLWPMRVALSGKEKSPDPFTLASILGKEETISRLRRAAAL